MEKLKIVVMLDINGSTKKLLNASDTFTEFGYQPAKDEVIEIQPLGAMDKAIVNEDLNIDKNRLRVKVTNRDFDYYAHTLRLYCSVY
jgi:hypothetical protein